jgi:hypothetical protein
VIIEELEAKCAHLEEQRQSLEEQVNALQAERDDGLRQSGLASNNGRKALHGIEVDTPNRTPVTASTFRLSAFPPPPVSSHAANALGLRLPLRSFRRPSIGSTRLHDVVPMADPAIVGYRFPQPPASGPMPSVSPLLPPISMSPKSEADASPKTPMSLNRSPVFMFESPRKPPPVPLRSRRSRIPSISRHNASLPQRRGSDSSMTPSQKQNSPLGLSKQFLQAHDNLRRRVSPTSPLRSGGPISVSGSVRGRSASEGQAAATTPSGAVTTAWHASNPKETVAKSETGSTATVPLGQSVQRQVSTNLSSIPLSQLDFWRLFAFRQHQIYLNIGLTMVFTARRRIYLTRTCTRGLPAIAFGMYVLQSSQISRGRIVNCA